MELLTQCCESGPDFDWAEAVPIGDHGCSIFNLNLIKQCWGCYRIMFIRILRAGVDNPVCQVCQVYIVNLLLLFSFAVNFYTKYLLRSSLLPVDWQQQFNVDTVFSKNMQRRPNLTLP